MAAVPSQRTRLIARDSTIIAVFIAVVVSTLALLTPTGGRGYRLVLLATGLVCVVITPIAAAWALRRGLRTARPLPPGREDALLRLAHSRDVPPDDPPLIGAACRYLSGVVKGLQYQWLSVVMWIVLIVFNAYLALLGGSWGYVFFGATNAVMALWLDLKGQRLHRRLDELATIAGFIAVPGSRYRPTDLLERTRTALRHGRASRPAHTTSRP